MAATFVARELFKPSKDPESLLVSIFFKLESFGYRFFVDEALKESFRTAGLC